jgi:SlyX protein
LNDRIKHLEEKVAYLERHVTEQDKAMLELVAEFDRLRKELRALRERPVRLNAEERETPDEQRPPHY